MAEEKQGSLIDRSRYGYDKFRVKDAAGNVRTSIGKGDAVAMALLVLPADKLADVVKKNKLAGKVIDNPSDYNAGQYRMTVGNMLRAKVKKGETVVIGKHTVASLTQKIDVEHVSVAPRAPKAAKPAGNGKPATKGIAGARAPAGAKSNKVVATRKAAKPKPAASGQTEAESL